MNRLRSLTWVLGALLCSRTASAQTAENVLLVMNDRSAASVEIGEYYARKRGLATEHMLRISAPPSDSVQRTEYERQIESPIASWLEEHGLQDQVLYIVLTKGVPLRIVGTEGLNGTIASVDSELTLLYRKMLGLRPTVVGQLANPYYLEGRDPSTAKPFNRADADIFLVTRLDGYTVEDVIKLIDRAQAPTSEGRVVLDLKARLTDAGGDRWLGEAGLRLKRAGVGDRVLVESTTALAATPDPVIGYYSWGSNDPSNRLRRFGLTFANGAIAGMFVSTDGRTFTEPPSTWVPNASPVGGLGTQSLIGDLIRDGVTGVAGHVNEPYLGATIRPQILFPAYLAGFNLAESFYLAMPYLSWQTVVVGDPLCAPFPRTATTTAPPGVALDPKTMLPALFSERRLNALTRPGINRDAIALSLLAESKIRAGNTAEAERHLEQAVDMEPRLTSANMRLAVIYQERKEPDRAIERYRRVLAQEPNNVAALNNLAYALAVDKQLPKEALPLAERAVAIASDPLVLDTLGWIHHLLGNDAAALTLINKAAAGAPDNVEVLIHAAAVQAAMNNAQAAVKTLDAAEKLDPRISERPDVRALRDRLKSS